MNLVYLKKFNNYYNRRVKYFDDLQSYIDNSDGYFFNPAVDFNPNDGVSTVKVANLDGLEFNPDYLLVLTEDNDKNIVSRWFVLESKRLRNGQYNITLRRDVIADHYDNIIDAPIFVQKGNVGVDNPLIYNKEGFACNQIKTKEVPLKDRTQTPWIVGYLGNDALADGPKTIKYAPSTSVVNLGTLPIKLTNPSDPEEGGTVSTISNFKLSTCYMWQPSIGFELARRIGVNWNYEQGLYNYLITDATQEGLANAIASFRNDTPGFPAIKIKEAFIDAMEYQSSAFELAADAFLEGIDEIVATSGEAEEIRQLNGQVVYSDITQKFYRIIVQTETIGPDRYAQFKTSTAQDFEIALNSIMEYVVNSIVNTYPDDLSRIPNNLEYYRVDYRFNITSIQLIETTIPDEVQITLEAGHKRLNDAPYSMFAMPYNLENLALANKIGVELSSFVYDIQILPYCPAIELIDVFFNIISTAVEGVDYCPITKGDTQVSYLLWATTSSNTFNISKAVVVDLSDPVELKVANECDMHRLVSPNYNGAFEFSAAKNGGVQYFEVSYTYKPYSPYIQVNPNFKNLYGTDFNDARGLICNGDFSIATITDQWKTYEINNKNYENIFNAQIKTLDKNNQLNLISQGISTPLNAAATGVTVGAMGGGLAGGIAAGAASLAGGIADIALGQSAFQNNRQLQKDMFAMNLQNIQARPDTLNKISAYNINNKYFPFVEYYTCTDTEKEAFRNKIKYEAMSLGIISTMRNFIGVIDTDYNFIKGSPIILEDISDDYHVAETIAVELEKGVYI